MGRCGFVQNIAPLSLSRDRKVKMEQNKQKIRLMLEMHLTNIYHQVEVTTRGFEGGTLICRGFRFFDAAAMLQLVFKQIYILGIFWSKFLLKTHLNG